MRDAKISVEMEEMESSTGSILGGLEGSLQ